MRYVNGIFCVVLGLFALAQYNDPDVLVWFAIYAIAGAFSGIAAFRPALYHTSGALRGAFWASFAIAAALTIYWWPTVWENWIHVEETREGIGMWIVMVAMLLVALGLRPGGQASTAPA